MLQWYFLYMFSVNKRIFLTFVFPCQQRFSLSVFSVLIFLFMLRYIYNIYSIIQTPVIKYTHIFLLNFVKCWRNLFINRSRSKVSLVHPLVFPPAQLILSALLRLKDYLKYFYHRRPIHENLFHIVPPQQLLVVFFCSLYHMFKIVKPVDNKNL